MNISVFFFFFKLQVLDPKNKGPPTCKCPDCIKKSKSTSISQSQTQLAFPKKSSNLQKTAVKKGSSESKVKVTTNQLKKNDTSVKNLSEEELFETCESCKVIIQCISKYYTYLFTHRSMYRIFPRKLKIVTGIV